MNTQAAQILDLGLDPRYASLMPKDGQLAAGSRAIVRMAGYAVLAVLLAFGAFRISKEVFADESSNAIVRISDLKVAEVSAMTVDDKSQIVATGLTAEERNAEIPISSLPMEQVSGFALEMAKAASYGTALQCLTQAVYYEAASEPLQGRRAVAQVVLNRMRHPAYPKSVCGVVYQGSQRRTGCQFSFTCDGSLMRTPSVGLWREAQAVARAALTGYVESSVGTATHYHADYVLPKWAFNLGKVNQLGRHIFYRFNGGMGSSLAFHGRYAGVESIPQVDFAALRSRLAEDGSLLDPAETFTPGLTVAPLITDRHAPADVGGRLDVTKEWRLNIPDPVSASASYRERIGVHEQPKGRETAKSGGDSEVAAADVDPKS
jgi:hypothetical protein